MIREFRIQGYGCIQDATLKLTPLHAVVGPNDSGKSTLLRALAGFVNAVGDGAVLPAPPPCASCPNTTIMAQFDEAPQITEGKVEVSYERDVNRWKDQVHIGNLGGPNLPFASRTVASIGRAQIIRLDADDLKQQSGILKEAQVALFPEGRGFGLAGVYDAILGRGDDTFPRIAEAVRRHFRTVANVRLYGVSNSTKAIGVKLTDGTLVEADQMSEGLLYYLAFAAMREVNNAKLLLIEEPENGLHPARIAEVVRMLRELSEQGTQIVIATHSPLVLNELRSDEVSVVTRTAEAGTKVTPIADTPNFAERAAVYALGELWLSYANGIDEAPLLEGKARAS